MLLQQIAELARQAVQNKLGRNVERIPLEFPHDRTFGDLTINAYLLAREIRGAPNLIAEELARSLSGLGPIESAASVKGFVNLRLATDVVFNGSLPVITSSPDTFGNGKDLRGLKLMVEFSAPNTNKPQHLGHMRTNFLGDSVAEILGCAGAEVVRANLFNDRGIHICKSMLAYEKFGEGATPESMNVKSDHFVGRFYVLFNKKFQEQILEFIENNPTDIETYREQHGTDRKGRPLDEETLVANHQEAFKEARFEEIPLGAECQEMLRKWEAGDEEVRALWKLMNGWAIDGFMATYESQSIAFDVIYRESETYRYGKDIVEDGLKRKVFYKREDGAVEVDLRADKLDKKVVLRPDGTSVYMTQDLGTTNLKAEQHELDGQVWVVGNEQRYHFQVLFKIMERLDYKYASRLFHLAYGMVHLPDGRMKSREGRVVDADDLLEEVTQLAAQEIKDRDPAGEIPKDEVAERARVIALAALKFMLLKVNATNEMVFNPEESVSFEGDTGARILYAYARLSSLLADGESHMDEKPDLTKLSEATERNLALTLLGFPGVVSRAAREHTPSVIANYLLDVVRDLNRFYDRCPVLKEDDAATRRARLELCKSTAIVLRRGADMLRIPLLARM